MFPSPSLNFLVLYPRFLTSLQIAAAASVSAQASGPALNPTQTNTTGIIQPCELPAECTYIGYYPGSSTQWPAQRPSINHFRSAVNSWQPAHPTTDHDALPTTWWAKPPPTTHHHPVPTTW